MKERLKVLFIAFIDFDGQYGSGSAVRPFRMLEAFKNLGYDVKVLEGATGKKNIKQRRKNVKATIKWIQNHDVDICYVEPPSGPFFCTLDLKLLTILKKKKIPIGLFYRDAYWKFPNFVYTKGFKEKVKAKIICKMQKRDWKVFENTCKCIYFPSGLLASYFVKDDILTLPPGCQLEKNEKARENNNLKSAIYVGGATEQYGIYLLLDSFNRINANGLKVQLICVCPKNEWNLLPIKYREYEKKSWIKIFHISSGKTLDNIYKQVDFSIIPRLKSEYTDLAMPIKLFEYLSKCKPVISTNCTESAQFIEKNGIGIIVEDNVESLVMGINKIISDQDGYNLLLENCAKTRAENTWEERVKKVVHDLSGR